MLHGLSTTVSLRTGSANGQGTPRPDGLGGRQHRDLHRQRSHSEDTWASQATTATSDKVAFTTGALTQDLRPSAAAR